MRRKRQILPLPLGSGRTKINSYFKSGAPLGRQNNAVNYGTIPGSQVTDSETHHWPPPSGEKGDVGGDFFTQKQYAVGRPARVSAWNLHFDLGATYDDYFFEGNVWPHIPKSTIYPPSIASNTSELIALGTKAIAECKPTNAILDLSSSLAEILREGIPRMPYKEWEEGTAKAKAAGSEYLNLQFGWLPLISDIDKVAKQIAYADKILLQYERDAGKVVRRKFEFPVHRKIWPISTGTDANACYYAPFNSRLMRPGYSTQVTGVRIEYQRTWFSGAFTYHLPNDYSKSEVRKSVRAKLGALIDTDLTPEVLWNLTPWSWAVDWFSSVGDVIDNATSWSRDGLVMRYGYLMQHSVVKDTYTPVEKRPFLNSSSQVDTSITYVTETKVRIRANPYGFGLTWGGLSPRQLAILAALGITRS